MLGSDFSLLALALSALDSPASSGNATLSASGCPQPGALSRFMTSAPQCSKLKLFCPLLPLARHLHGRVTECKAGLTICVQELNHPCKLA